MQQWQVGPVPEYIYGNSTQHANDIHSGHTYQPDMSRRNDFTGYAPQPPNAGAQQHQAHPQHHQPLAQHQQHQNQTHQPPHGSHPQHPHHQPHQQSHQPQQHHATPVPPPMTIPQPTAPSSQQSTPTPAPAAAPRGRKRAAPSNQQAHQQPHQQPQPQPHVPVTATASSAAVAATTAPAPVPTTPAPAAAPIAVPPPQVTPVAPPAPATDDANSTPVSMPPTKKSRTNTPWTPAEELRLKQMRDAGNSWAEIAKTFPTRTEGSVKKHWYKDMHYAEFAEDESQALLSAIKDYENNKWKTIGQKVGKPAKACEQYAKEHFPELFAQQKQR